MLLTNKEAWKKTLKAPGIWIFALFLIAAIIFQVFFAGCRQVNQKRAVEFYEQSVEHFPEENI